MPEDDKEKAAKLAAAKKRYEQIKKQKGKTAPVKASGSESTAPEAEEKAKDVEAVGAEKGADEATEEPAPAELSKPTGSRPHGRQPSISLQSKMRSESFRKSVGPLSPSLKSPTVPSISPDADNVSKAELSRRLKEVEKELEEERAARNVAEEKSEQLEDEVGTLRNSQTLSGDAKKLKIELEVAVGWHRYYLNKNRSWLMEFQQSELRSAQRQNAQLQNAASKRRESGSSPGNNVNADLEAQLQSKSNTIESLELELSKLQNQLTSVQALNETKASRISALESQLQKADYTAKSTAQELTDLKKNLDRASERAVAEGSSRSSAETRIAQLEAELGTAKRSVDEATRRTENLEKKVETLTTLHRESDARSQAKVAEMQWQEREAKELRARVTALGNENGRLRDEAMRRRRLEAAGDDAGLEELEDEERQKMQSRIRELEEEVFELRRGVWRDKRRELQPGLDEKEGFDDVDLSASMSSPYRPHPTRQGGSTFTDVINSGISAFTGRDRRGSGRQAQPPRKQSLGLLSDDDDAFEFDEEAFRLAQEDEAKKRLERIKEVKRGLSKWKNFRVDLVEVRKPLGGVFEV